MSILLVRGDDGSSTGRARLALERETELLLEVYDSLPSAHKRAMLRPQVCQPTLAEFSALLTQAPDVLWLSGHGSGNPPAFILADGSALTPQELGRAIASAPARPLFAVFWACDTARAPEVNREAPSPPFYEALLKSGVATILAMQAPVTDRGAILMAQEVFQALAAGEALDTAAVHARTVLLDAAESGSTDGLDWACPVVWSSGLPAVQLGWGCSPTPELAQLQTASRRARLNRDGRVFFPPTRDELGIAQRWTASLPCWVKGGALAAHKERWIRQLIAMQVVLPRYVVAVEFVVGQMDAAEGLMSWAEELQQTLEPADAPGGDFRNILEQMKSRPKEAWGRLCSLPHVLVSVWNPPTYGSEAWFWTPLSRGLVPAVVMGEHIDGRLIPDGWFVEDIEMPIGDEVLDAAHEEAPILGNALALLGMAVPRSSVGVSGSTLDTAPRIGALVITTAANEVVLPASAAKRFRSMMDQTAIVAAHRACMEILAHNSLAGRLTPAVREERLTHCLGANEEMAVVEEACALLTRYRAQDRPQAVLGVMRRLGKLWRALPEHILLYPTWAHTVLGNLDQAQFWLNRSTPETPLEKAWQHGLQAELYKASGGAESKEAALAEIDAAIAILRGAPDVTTDPFVARRLRAYRQDRARIFQYLFYRVDLAAAEYKQLLEDWMSIEDAAIDVAVVLRNYSECIRSGHVPKTEEWRRSMEMLDQAEKLLEGRQDHPLYAEIQYEKARIAIAESRADAADLLLSARAAASASGHLMLSAISASRYFWQFDRFDLSKWEALEAGLAAFPHHGWAVRTLIDGRLRAAKCSLDRHLAHGMMLANLDDLARNPSFDAGSDRFRIAASSAGCDLLAADRAASGQWNQFLSRQWAPVWLVENGFRIAENVWEKVL